MRAAQHSAECSNRTPLQEMNTEAAPPGIGNTADQARLDIRAKGFWSSGQDAYFDVRVTNPICGTAIKSSFGSVYD